MGQGGIWSQLSGVLRASDAYRGLREGRGEAKRLPTPAAAWVAELLGEDLCRPVLAVVPHETDALAWLEAASLVGGSAVYFPAPSLSPYHEAEISLQVRAQEADALDRVLTGSARTLVCTPRALFRRLPRAADFGGAVIELRAGEERGIEELVGHLSRFGYRRSDLVSEVGEFAVRGGVFDLFPAAEPSPVRLDLFGDTVESIRRFRVEDQRSLEPVEAARVLPLTLFPAGAEEASRLADQLASGLAGRGSMAAADALERLRHGGVRGWEQALPLLAPATAALPELLENALSIAVAPSVLRDEAEHHARLLAADFEALRAKGRLAVEPRAIEHPLESVLEILERCPLRVRDPAEPVSAAAVDFGGASTDLFHGQLPRFPRELETARARGERLLLVSQVEHHRRLEHWCESQGLEIGPRGVELVEGELQRGFRLPPAALVVFGEQQLFPPLAPARRRPRGGLGAFVSTLRDLKVGDFVVHDDHGIGQLVALRAVGPDEKQPVGLPPALRDEVMGSGNREVEVMEIAYQGGRRLLLPLTRLDQIQRYSGIEGVAPRLDRLGGTSWSRTKARIKAGMQKLAGSLLRLYAERQLARAPAMPDASDLQAQFDAAFDYEETEDQTEAIATIREDLQRERPMDRLLCGDVGFGKTEVAMRAAFQVVAGGYQVAVLAPTTILADQHLETFEARFSGFPVRIGMISRRRLPSEVRQIRGAVAGGELDILIGTHRLLSRDIDFSRLGLLIVDEEQRFGVAQKERLRELKKNVHVLSMSATPVPRTLQLSLAGVRDLSVIETPPRDRMAVETIILPFTPEAVREAIEFELERGGQVYYVYNRVEGIEGVAASLRRILPDLRLTVGHGQMDENELAERMRDFKRRRYDVLLATTIIENGIDISNVNTMIVHDAQRFGLAQLYQLRGRVGRSHQLAYCYLLVPTDRILSEDARKRLGAIREFSELGAGFRVAARDLQIRGAGNLLGAEQSGHITAVGMETYLKMLAETVRELRGEEIEAPPSVAIDLPVSMSIPREYLGDDNLRMEIYRRIVAGEAPENEILDELRDRFGPPPEPVRRLLEVAALKRRAEHMRVQSISARGGRLQIRMRRDARIDVDRLVRLVAEGKATSFSPTGMLVVDRIPAERAVSTAAGILEEVGVQAG